MAILSRRSGSGGHKEKKTKYIMRTSTLFFFPTPPPPPPSLPFFATSTQRLLSTVHLPLLAATRSSPCPRLNPRHAAKTKTARGRRPLTATSAADDDDVEAGAGDDYDMEEDEVEELDNKKDYDVEYDRLLGPPISARAAAVAADSLPDDIEMVTSESFVSTQGWDSDTVVDYRINEEEFHKIRLLHCDFFIRKPPDPDHNVYDFREYIRCSKTNFGCYNVMEPPIDAPRDPLYKTEREILKVRTELQLLVQAISF
ncbi:hypothetical protein BHE74_00043838 [Ensete ventricosum]|uniref:Uncharacterized protein n=1 Tax=Ensete ventricosum TaxID=4639 RepID=A0A444D881_ENSVE|nr:hypothetical protein GW17_00043113 [Ensete ventricosum]RWW49937.1 hypothetical protein BHE74_00043838 [Ensete ventricosum]RZR75110.1 hypothetical protein BHM03_00049629 [Ensete ventricosum]